MTCNASIYLWPPSNLLGMCDYLSMNSFEISHRMQQVCADATNGMYPVCSGDRSLCSTVSQLPRCEAWLQKSCIKMYDFLDCQAAVTFCDAEIYTPFYSLGLFIFALPWNNNFLMVFVSQGINTYDMTDPWSASHYPCINILNSTSTVTALVKN